MTVGVQVHMDEPPSYASIVSSHGHALPPSLSHALSDELSLPAGLFIIRSRYSGLALQVKDKRTADGTSLELNEVRQPAILGDSQSLINAVNTQLFYLDWDGHLVSASSSKQIDVIDGRLILASPKPVQAVPSRTSHPLPRFKLDAHTHTLQVRFSCDPLFRGPGASPSNWRDETYALEYVSRQGKPFEPTLWEVASSNIISNLGSRISELGMFVKTPSLASLSQIASSGGTGLSTSSSSCPPVPPPKERRRASMPPNFASTNGIGHAPGVTIERVEESDDDEDIARPVRVVRLSADWRDRYDSSSKEWSKRQWEVVPVVVRPIPTSTHRIPDRNKLPEHLYSFDAVPTRRSSTGGATNRRQARERERDLPNVPVVPARPRTTTTTTDAQDETDDIDADLLSEEAIAAHIDALSVSSSMPSTRQGTPVVPSSPSLHPSASSSPSLGDH